MLLRMEVDTMLKKRKRVVVQLTAKEVRVFRDAMIYFRNLAIREGKPTEDIDAIILRLCKS